MNKAIGWDLNKLIVMKTASWFRKSLYFEFTENKKSCYHIGLDLKVCISKKRVRETEFLHSVFVFCHSDDIQQPKATFRRERWFWLMVPEGWVAIMERSHGCRDTKLIDHISTPHRKWRQQRVGNEERL